MKKTAIPHLAFSVLMLSVAADPADAAPECAMSYEHFETAVPHIDMERCPEGGAPATSFCRAAVGGDRLHVYRFAEDGDQCLIAVRSYDEEAFTLTIKPR